MNEACERCGKTFSLELTGARRSEWYPDLCTSCEDEVAEEGKTWFEDMQIHHESLGVRGRFA